MTRRDRLVAVSVVTLALLAAGWLLLVSPERQKASKLDGQISAANAQLSTAEGEVTNARGAQARYGAAYATIVNLGKAVPSAPEVPSLVYQLDQASNNRGVDFSSIATTTASSGSGSSASAAGSASSASLAAPTTFTPMPFTFVFNGGFFQLYNLFHQLDSFTTRNAAGALQVSGRLLTVQSVKLAPTPSSLNASSAAGGSSVSTGELSGTITASAYVLPASQGLTAGATASGPAGSTVQSTTSGSSATPAVVRVTP